MEGEQINELRVCSGSMNCVRASCREYNMGAGRASWAAGVRREREGGTKMCIAKMHRTGRSVARGLALQGGREPARTKLLMFVDPFCTKLFMFVRSIANYAKQESKAIASFGSKTILQIVAERRESARTSSVAFFASCRGCDATHQRTLSPANNKSLVAQKATGHSTSVVS